MPLHPGRVPEAIRRGGFRLLTFFGIVTSTFQMSFLSRRRADVVVLQGCRVITAGAHYLVTGCCGFAFGGKVAKTGVWRNTRGGDFDTKGQSSRKKSSFFQRR